MGRQMGKGHDKRPRVLQKSARPSDRMEWRDMTTVLRYRVGSGTAKNLITESDISFDGWFRLPSIGGYYSEHFMFSRGGLATRVVGDERRFFTHTQNVWISGETGIAGYVCEYVDPESYGSNPTTAPIATVSRFWGNIYGTSPSGLNYPSEAAHWSSYLTTDGDRSYGHQNDLFWDGSKLWWNVCRQYTIQNWDDPFIGCSELNDDTGVVTAHGPWRMGTEHYARYCDWFTEIPSWFQGYVGGKQFAIGGTGQHSGYQTVPYGVNINAWESLEDIDTSRDPYDENSQTGSASMPDATTMIGYTMTNRLTVSQRGYYRRSWPNEGEGPYGCTYPLETGNFGGSDGWGIESKIWAEQLDDTSSCVWVDLDDKHGVIWFGQLCETIPGYTATGDPDGFVHFGYGDPNGPSYGEGRPYYYCCHGQDDPYWGATGPFCNQRVPWVFIMDPTKFIPVINETQDPWYTTHDSAFRLSNILELSGREGGGCGVRIFGGAVYDKTSRNIYVLVTERDASRTMYAEPAIAVFHIS